MSTLVSVASGGAHAAQIGGKSKGVYLYGMADKGLPALRMGKIGIGGVEVYTIPCQGLSAIVHDCAERPYESKDARIVEGWIREHEKVLEIAMNKFGNVIPFRFNTIIGSENHRSTPSSTLRKWISKELPGLRKKMAKIRGKREYGVQILYLVSAMTRKIAVEQNEEMKLNVDPSSKGTAYMYRLKFERAAKRELEARVASYFKDFYGRIGRASTEIKVEKTRMPEEKDTVMLMNLSVLADDKQLLGSCLEKIKKKNGFSVRFTGPWPPYSFV
ncbi:MAG: GvpL/GvpF family gas vesicle protein [Nitrososphaerota archaeon]|nr:GvpL/GvpF family gas vesicle protein [Nitrososphaerota archaeon]